ncbi:MAG: DEAD/DEAH box helicase, partial [Gemmatimonadaceae bacterium]|nr:DEAD/DEAH box helicase [Gemmatimonadaceae bacterium]
TTPRLGLAELTAMYEEALGEVRSIREYRGAPLRLPLTGWVSPEERERLLALPGHLDLRNKPVGIEYDVEEGGGEDGRPATVGVARLVLPEKLARTLVDEELPRLDRPLRFVVHRGQRGSVRAATLRELQELLDRPWSPDERQAGREERDEERHRRRRERDAADVRGQFARERRHGRPGGGRGGDGRGRDDRKGRGGGGRRGR